MSYWDMTKRTGIVILAITGMVVAANGGMYFEWTEETADQKLFLDKVENAVKVFGHVGSQNSPNVIVITGNVNLDAANGYAQIAPASGTLTTLRFTPDQDVDTYYNAFTFNAQFLEKQTITVKVQPNGAALLETFEYEVTQKNANIGPLGIVAKSATPSVFNTFKWVEIYAPLGFFQEKQNDFSIGAVPEPTTIVSGALLILPFGLASLRSLRRNTRR